MKKEKEMVGSLLQGFTLNTRQQVFIHLFISDNYLIIFLMIFTHLDPLFICLSIITYGLDFVEILACVNDTAE